MLHQSNNRSRLPNNADENRRHSLIAHKIRRNNVAGYNAAAGKKRSLSVCNDLFVLNYIIYKLKYTLLCTLKYAHYDIHYNAQSSVLCWLRSFEISEVL